MGVFLIATTPIFLAIIHELDTERLAFVNGVYMTISFTMSSLMVLLVGIASDFFGIIFTLPSLTAFIAGPANFSMATNHCVDILGSTVVSHLEHLPVEDT